MIKKYTLRDNELRYWDGDRKRFSGYLYVTLFDNYPNENIIIESLNHCKFVEVIQVYVKRTIENEI